MGFLKYKTIAMQVHIRMRIPEKATCRFAMTKSNSGAIVQFLSGLSSFRKCSRELGKYGYYMSVGRDRGWSIRFQDDHIFDPFNVSFILHCFQLH